MKDFIGDGILLDLGDHDFVDEVNFPKLLVVAIFFIVFGVDWLRGGVLSSVEDGFFMAISWAIQRSSSCRTSLMSLMRLTMVSPSRDSSPFVYYSFMRMGYKRN